jgi:cobalt-zinc-cadmium efflux system outer membrane protein
VIDTSFKYIILFATLITGLLSPRFTQANTLAGDSIRLSIRAVDSLFLARNFDLLAGKMRIESQKALAIQARVFTNPVFTAEWNLYNPAKGKFLDVGEEGQKSFQLEQLLLLGGKRRNAMELAATNIRIAELEFEDLLRNLKFELHTSVYAYFEQQALLSSYNRQLVILDTVIRAYEELSVRGIVAARDLVRIKGTYLDLILSRAELMNTNQDLQVKLQTLLQLNAPLKPFIEERDYTGRIHSAKSDELTDLALRSRADYLLVVQNKVAAEQLINFQKSMAVPDLRVYGAYDQRGGAFVNQVNLGVSIPLPVWNRNRGNIQASRFQLREKEYSEAGLKSSIMAEVEASVLKYNQSVTTSGAQRPSAQQNLKRQ